jgi:aryl-alcohol dehydrogenase-like predicted oxidoreductase
MEKLVREGKVLYVGSSNFAGWHIAQANDVAQHRHFLGLVVEQCGYSLLSRKVEMEVLPACAAYGMGVVPYEPLAEGILAGAFQKPREGYRSSERVQQRIEQHRAALEAYERLCQEVGEPPAVVALAWLLSRPGVTAPVVGWRKPEHLDSAVRAVEISLAPDTLAQLDALFPGPGPAPEAY